MAVIYRGMSSELDERMLGVLEKLPDEYHVFTTFCVPDWGREIDFLVIRQHRDLGGIFCLEVKDETRCLMGTMNGPWRYQEVPYDYADGAELPPEAWVPYPRPNREDDNPLQQAYNNAKTFKLWLSSMRALIQDPDDPWTPQQVHDLTVFPRLVLSRAHPRNQIQFHKWVIRFDSYEEVLTARCGIPNWIPKQPFYLSDTEIARIAEHLGMAPGQRVERSVETFELPDLGDVTVSEHLAALTAEVNSLRELVRVQSTTIQELRWIVHQHEGMFARFAEVFNNGRRQAVG